MEWWRQSKTRAERYLTKFGKDIIVQGSYEKLFVEYCESNNIDVQNGPCIEYKHNGDKHRYFADFQLEINGKKKYQRVIRDLKQKKKNKI